jgi:folate-binding protein YgfZ
MRAAFVIINIPMIFTPLQDALRKHASETAAPMAESEYRGATAAAVFGDAGEEFAALRDGCGVHDLGFRARISVKGGDRVRWMNGMVTNNIRDLAAGHGVYAFLLNAQGRILGDMHVYNAGEALEVETDRAQLDKILATFDHFIIMDDVEISSIGENWTALGVTGPKSREILLAAGIEFPELQPLEMATAKCNCDCGCVECTIIRSDLTEGSYELWIAPKDVYQTWQGLVAAGAKAVGSRAWEMLRISLGVPLYGVDIRERDLPQETEQARALNFNKGCYVGQEIVERIRSRGNVHRKFTGFLSLGVAKVAAGDKIVVAEKEVGEITSAAILPASPGEQTVALGYIRREVGAPGQEVAIAGVKATVTQLPLGGALPETAGDAVLRQA